MRVLDDYSLFAWRSIEEDYGGILVALLSAFVNSDNII